MNFWDENVYINDMNYFYARRSSGTFFITNKIYANIIITNAWKKKPAFDGSTQTIIDNKNKQKFKQARITQKCML